MAFWLPLSRFSFLYFLHVHRSGVVERVLVFHPAEVGILISILCLGVCPLYSVLCFNWRWPDIMLTTNFREARPLCNCLVFWSKVYAPYRHLINGHIHCKSRSVSPTLREGKKERRKVFLLEKVVERGPAALLMLCISDLIILLSPGM